MEKIKKRPMLMFALILIALYLLIYVAPSVTGALRTSYTTEYGRLQVYDEETGYIVRTETVYAATQTGTPNRYIEEGKLVRKGTHIMDVVAEEDQGDSAATSYATILSWLGDAIVTENSYGTSDEGVVSYTVDGYEAELSPETMLDFKESYYKRLSQSNVKTLSDTYAVKGDPVFKIADRAHWYIVCFIPTNHGDRYEEGQSLSVRINDEKTIDGTVYALDEMNGKIRLVVETNYYYKNFASTREAQVKVITSDARGLLIQNSSIAEVDGVTGVYVKQKTGGYEFTPISVIATDGENSVVRQNSFTDSDGNVIYTVESYDTILTKAK